MVISGLDPKLTFLKMVDEKDEFPVKVGDDIYGPISLERLTTDLKNGNLTIGIGNVLR